MIHDTRTCLLSVSLSLSAKELGISLGREISRNRKGYSNFKVNARFFRKNNQFLADDERRINNNKNKKTNRSRWDAIVVRSPLARTNHELPE